MLANQDFDKFKSIDLAMLQRVEQMLAKDIADIMTLVPQEAASGSDISGKILMSENKHCLLPNLNIYF